MFVPGMPFTGNTLKEASLGGSETAALCMARELASLGHDVYLFGNGEPGEYDGVYYMPLDQWDGFVASTPHDVAIVQRIPYKFIGRTAAKLNLLWCHDLALGRNAQEFKGVLWNIDRVMLLSQYHIDQYQETLDLHEDAILHTRNGVDLNLFKQSKRDPKTIMYCARPERGLDRLLKEIMPELLKRHPDIKLKIATYENPVDHFQDLYAECDHIARTLFPENVEYLGALTKEKLYEEYAKARCYVYPTPSPVAADFREISCISLMECMAAGLPVVATRIGALPETLATGAGKLIKDDENHTKNFVNAVSAYLDDHAAFSRASEAGKRASKNNDWEIVAQEWTEEIYSLFDQLNDDPERLARHFIQHSDVVAAREVCPEDSPLQELLGMLGEADYENLPAQEGSFEDAIRDPRFTGILHWVEECAPEKLLDYGCGCAYQAVHLSNLFPDLKVTAVDVNPQALEEAEKTIAQYAQYPDNILLKTTEEFKDYAAALQDGYNYDVATCFEVLEHVEEPWKLATEIENYVAKGGHVIITVPFGPWERGQPIKDKQHLWEFDKHDLEDMFLEKKMSHWSRAATEHQDTNEPLGHNYVIYEADHVPVPEIDMARKLKLQRPVETVGAALIAGPGCEETLLWCLRSIRPVVDQIVIANTGMAPLAEAMAKDLGAVLVDCESPLSIGFDACRNLSISHIKTDWCLWIDTDEKLLDRSQLQKYLRQSIYNGYSIRQHHFAVDMQAEPDMPVRLFKMKPYEGKQMQFFGRIHEHPELEMNEGPGPTIVVGDVHIAHMGYLTEETRQSRFWRNKPMLEKDIQDHPDRILQKHFICRDNMLLVKFMLQQNGQRITNEIKRLCEETIAIYKEHLIGNPRYVHVDTLQYYSDALTVLGRGVDVRFDLETSKEGYGEMTGPGVRVESEEDFRKEFDSRVSEAFKPFQKKWF